MKQENLITEYFPQTISLPRFKLIKELNKDIQNQDNSFIPFIKERDRMNRLVRITSERKNYTEQSRSPPKINTPDRHWHFNENYVLPEKRKKVNVKFNYQIKIEPREQSQSTIRPLSSKPEEPKLMRIPIQRNNIRTKTKKLQIQSLPEEQKKFQIQVSAEVLQPYIAREMEQMKQDLFFKVDMDYHFPSDLTDKLIQQKQHIEKLKRRLKEWGEVKTPEDIEDLKEYAKFILKK